MWRRKPDLSHTQRIGLRCPKKEIPKTSDADNRSVEMKTLILSSAAAAALTLALTTASAQTRLEGNGVVMLTPEQQTAIRRVIRERLVDQARERLPQILESRVALAEKLAQQATEAAKLTPEQQTAIPCATMERPLDQRRARVPAIPEAIATSAEQVAQQATDAAKLTPEQQTAIRRVIRERLVDQVRERFPQVLESRV